MESRRIFFELWGKTEILGASPIFVLPPLVDPLVLRINLYVFESGTPHVMQLSSPQKGVIKLWPTSKLSISHPDPHHVENPLRPVLEAPGILQLDGLKLLETTFTQSPQPKNADWTTHGSYYPYEGSDLNIHAESFFHITSHNTLYPAQVQKTKSPYLTSLFQNKFLNP